jgi:hypothetical protein
MYPLVFSMLTVIGVDLEGHLLAIPSKNARYTKLNTYTSKAIIVTVLGSLKIGIGVTSWRLSLGLNRSEARNVAQTSQL